MVIMKYKSTRLNKEAWLSEALEVLYEYGIDKVSIEPLAKRLGVTKGSFYWHFKNKEDFLSLLPSYWAEKQTTTVMTYVKSQPGNAKSKMKATLEYLAREDPDRYDNAMRAWAYFDSNVAKAVATIDKRRLEFVCDLFLLAGLNNEEAEMRSRIWYYYDIGEHITGDTPKDPDKRMRRAELRLAILSAGL